MLRGILPKRRNHPASLSSDKTALHACFRSALASFFVYTPHVPCQMLASMKILVANPTVKRRCLVLPFVPSEVRRVSTGVLTEVALEDLLTSVCPFMGD